MPSFLPAPPAPRPPRRLLAVLFLTAFCAGSAHAADLGTGRLLLTGTRLSLSPESQTVPFNTATIVDTALEGFDPASGVLPSDLKVVADLTGPEIDGLLRLETVPGEPFRIPRLSVKGEYRLENVRLVEGSELLAYAEPRSAAILVTQVLVTRVTSRALSLDEVRSYGVVLGEGQFHAFNFTFGFAVAGETFDYNLPVLIIPGGDEGPRVQVLRDRLTIGGSTGTSSPRFRPPQLAPFELRLAGSGRPDPLGGCLNPEGCKGGDPVVLPGAIVFPTDVLLLNQFFSVVVVAANAAPEGDPLTIRDLTARITLPPGLRQAETEPPTPLGVPVPVRVPGLDGELGTADDLTFLVAQAEGRAEVLVEGRKQGTHLVRFDLEGVLDGFPDGELRRVTGQAQGAVVVRDPTLGLTITHPEVVRADEEYSLLLTISNTSNAPVNLLSFTLPVAGLSGVEVVGSSTRTIDTLAAGDSEVVEFRLRSLRTGKVVASSIRSGSRVDPRFELSVGVGDAGIPLSPDAIILPDSSNALPADLVRRSLGLIGLGYSLGTAPATSIPADLPQISLESVHEKVYWLGQAGRHVELGEELFDAAAVLAAEWTGVRNDDADWDWLRRATGKGGLVADALATVFADEAAAAGAAATLDRFAATTAYLGPFEAVLGVGSGVSVAVESRASGRRLAGTGIDPLRLRELPFGDLYDLQGAQMALLGSPEEAGYRVRIADADGGTDALHLVVRDETGQVRVARWTGISLAPGGSAELVYRGADSGFNLAVDADGDGTPESQVAGTQSTLAPRPFTVVAAVQKAAVVTGHVIEVLLSQDVDLGSLLPRDPSHFTLPGNLSNGGLVEVESDLCEGGLLGGCTSATDPGSGQPPGSPYEDPHYVQNPFEGLLNTRVVQVVFNNPVSPYKTHQLTVRDLGSVSGQTVTSTTVPIQTTVTQPGGIVQGTVYGSDGLPVPLALVELYEVDHFDAGLLSGCQRHRTASVQADAFGRFEFDYVRQTDCSDVFQIRGADLSTSRHGTATGRLRFVGQTTQLDVVMLGRGTVRGRVTYEDGSVPENPDVVGYSPVFFEGYEATYGADGSYEIRDLPVGTLSLGASDRQGSFVYQTVEIPRAGAVVERNLTIIRRPPDEATGDVRGTVFQTDGTTPVYDAYVALYVDGELAGVERSAPDGGVDFGTVRAGLAEIEAFDGATGLSGAQLYFDVEPDQVNDVTVLLRDDRATVEGHVYRQTLNTVEPAANVVVWVSGTPFNTVTDENGYYRLESVFAGNRTLIAADLERQVQVSASVSIGTAGDSVYRDLYFVESVGSGLAGEVLGFTGNPVAGAKVHLASGDQWFAEAITDLNGRFTFPDLRPGTYHIHGFAGTAGVVKQATIRFEGETPFVTLRFKKGTIQGSTKTINESGQLIGVRSLVTYRTTVVLQEFGLVDLDWFSHTIETDANGDFEIPDVLSGAYQLTVSNAFYGEKTIRDEMVFDGEVRRHDIVFQPNGRIHGVVLDWDGETPVPGATVHLRHPSFSEYDVTTDANGAFAFELVPPYHRRFPIDAEIERNGVFRTARIWVGFNKPGQELDVEAVLPMQGTVSGWVEDSNGAVVPGAVVTLREHAFPQRQIIHNADQGGNFSFTNVFAGPVSLSAQAPALGGLGGRDAVELVQEGQEVYSVIYLEATGEVVGRVLSPETGEVVPTAQVTLDRSPRGIYDSLTTTEGEFRFRLLPLGLYRVRVFDPATGRFGLSDWTDLDTNGQVLDIDVVLEARGDVDGHLYEPGSLLGVPGATVRLSTRSIRPFTTYSSTDVDGYFEFQGIPEGEFTLQSAEPGGRRKASGAGEIVEEDEVVTVDLYLEATGRVVGSVLEPAGRPDGLFANSNVLVYESSQVVGATLDNPFSFDGILTGKPLTLRAYENGGDHRGIATGKLAAGESEITLDVRMVPLGTAAVTVLDGSGSPVAGADVRLTNNGFYGYRNLAGSTGADGRALFSGIGEGWISVSVTRPSTVLRGSANSALALDGEQVEILVQLEDSGSVTGRVVTADGVTPAEDALVVVVSAGRTLQILADANGDFEVPSVPLGAFTLFVQESFGPGSLERAGSLGANGDVVAMGTLVLDDRDPAVVSIVPASGSVDLPLSTVMTVRFSEPVDPTRWSGGWTTFRKVGSSNVASTPSWSEGNTVLTLTPNAPLASFTAYELIVRDAYDLAGRHLAEPARTTFNTVDVVPPAVVDVLPRDGQDEIPIDASVLVTFSEPVAFASLSGSAFQLTDVTTGAGVTTTFQHLTGERQVLLTPAYGLETDHEYRLTVQNVADAGGNAMPAPVSTHFWSVDTIPPQIDSVTFPAGTSFVSGDDVPVEVAASDAHGVASVEIAISEWSWTDDLEPFELGGLAPVVTSTEDVTVHVTARDVHGLVTTTDRTIQVQPRQNPNAPEVAPLCGRAGDVVAPGVGAVFQISASDDESIESFRFFVEGQELGRKTPVDEPSSEASFEWTPPDGAAPGTEFTIRLEARDFAANLGVHEFTVTVPAGEIRRTGGSLFDTFQGEVLVLAEGDYLARETLNVAGLYLLQGATLTAGDAAEPLEIVTPGIVRLQCGDIDVTAKGYPHDTAPDGIAASSGYAGGSHGGRGDSGTLSAPAGDVYDSVYQPRLAGGGGGSIDGASGGGAISIDASEVVLDGDLLAMGAPWSGDRVKAGGGGAVRVRAGSLSGGGRIDVSGGDGRQGYYGPQGGGGGGRVALEVGTFDGFDPAEQIFARGGNGVLSGYGAAGTIFIHGPEAVYGDLVIDNGRTSAGEPRIGLATELPDLGAGSVSALESAGADAWLTGSETFRPRWLGTWVTLLDPAGSELGSFQAKAIDAAGRLLLEGAGAQTLAASFQGTYRFDQVELRDVGGLRATDPLEVANAVLEGAVSLAGELGASNLQVKAGAILTPAQDAFRLAVAEVLTVEAGATLDASFRGYGAEASPEGIAGSLGYAGGSHGGRGDSGTSTNPAGEVYDSVYQPRLAGGGGASTYGGSGGGAIEIEAGEVVLDGAIMALGEAWWGDRGKGGAGGTVRIVASSMSGTGRIDASGGDGHSGYYGPLGGGGGGRVSLDVGTLLGFDPATQVRTQGGTGVLSAYAAAGTLLVKTSESVYGDLVVDNGQTLEGEPRTGLATELPILGSGTITAMESAGEDAWLTGSAPFLTRWLGAWLRLFDAAGVDLGAFRGKEIDPAGRLLLEGAADASAAATYQGEYRFDQVVLRNGGSLQAVDPVDSLDVTIEQDADIEGELHARNLTVRSGVVLHPVGDGFRLVVSERLTIEAGALLDAHYLGYGNDEAPEGSRASVGKAGGSHGGSGDSGTSSEPAGEVYDSVYEPRWAGGGGAGYFGGSGGGVVEIEAGELVLNGDVLVQGESWSGDRQTAGAGGTVRIVAGSMSGTGRIDASGGDGNLGYYGPQGGGGGGRVALEVGTLLGFDPATQVSVRGGRGAVTGTYAAAGTLYLKSSTSTYGDLVIDNEREPDGTPRIGLPTELPALGEGNVTAFGAEGPDAWLTGDDPFRTRWLGTWVTLRDALGEVLGSFRAEEIDEAGRLRLGAAAGATTAMSYEGGYRFDRVVYRDGGGFVASDAVEVATVEVEGATAVAGTLAADALVVREGAELRPAGGTLQVDVTGTLTVEVGARLDASHLGYGPGGGPAGVGVSLGDAGGSHGGGGDGGTATNPASDTYDSVYAPRRPGGGGAGSDGRSGGGVIAIDASDVVLQGEILAVGESWSSDRGKGGAGGSVTIRASSLSGTGTIDVSGGDGANGTYGPHGEGGGGRVALDVDTIVGFDPAAQVVAQGGHVATSGTSAAAGTVFVRTSAATFGDLLVDQEGLTGAAALPTVLPAIGKGFVGAVSADAENPADLWIGDQDPAKLFSLGVDGMWVRIGGVDYPVIGQSADLRQLLLQGAAGAVSSGDAYLGIYKFDAVTVTGEASLELRDGDEVGAWNVDPGSTLTRFDLDPPEISVTSPAAGALFVVGDQVEVAATVTDPSGVASVTFRLGGDSLVDDAAPYDWTVLAPDVEVEQDVSITVEALDGNGNLAVLEHTIRVRPVAPGDPPVVTLGCPSPGARLAPGTGLDLSVTATHDDGIDRVELLVGSDPDPIATDLDAPYTLHYDVPAGALDGDVIDLHLRARSVSGLYGEVVYPLAVVAANVVTADTFLSSADLSLDDASLVVAGGTLTVEGSHTFRDLVVLDGAAVTHPASTATTVEWLDLSLTRDLFVACGGSIDATAKGYSGGESYQDPGAAPSLLTDDFSDGDLAGWQKVDEGEEGGPSNWSVSAGALRQTTNIVSNINNQGFGTNLVWSTPLAADDYRYSALLRSTDDDVIGLLFRYVDAGNTYRFWWTRQSGQRYLEKVVDGQRITLASDAVPYATNTWYLIEIVVDGPEIELWIDGQRIFRVTDATFPAGTVGAFCVANAGSYFDDFQVVPLEWPSSQAGASHGGRGGSANGANPVYGNLFDPRDPGAGGGGLSGAGGGGVVRISAAGQAVIDGSVAARGAVSASPRPASAGGSIRLDAASIVGLGSIDASGGGAAGTARAAGGGGRIALYAGSIDDALVDRTLAAGGDADTPARRGAAGTVFVKRDAAAFGDLLLDDGGLDTDQPTELLGFPPGVLDGVGVSSVTDDEADFVHDLAGIEVFFEGDRSTLWTVTGNDHHGQTLDLDTSSEPLTALAGDSYEGLYRFDRVIVRGGAEALTQAEVQSTSAPEVEAGASWAADYQPSVTFTSPLPGATVTSGSPIAVSVDVDDPFGALGVRILVDGQATEDLVAPFGLSITAPAVTAGTDVTIVAVAWDRSGHEASASTTVHVEPSDDAIAPTVAVGDCPRSGDHIAPGVPIALSYSIFDDGLLDSYRLLVDGAVAEEVTDIESPSASGTFSWTPPAGSVPGSTHTVRLEATDFGNNTAAEEWAFTVASGLVLVGSQSIDSTVDGEALVLAGGTFTAIEPIAPQALTLIGGAVLGAPPDSPLDVTVAGELLAECGTAIDLSGRGYEGGNNLHEPGLAPPGLTASGRDEGGSHGGEGGSGYYASTQDPGEVFDSVYLPSLGGGGGGRETTSAWGGSGGGVVLLEAASVVLDGEIRARGQNPPGIYAGAGAGGSVVVLAGSLSGDGLIDASGGDYIRTGGAWGPPGGGGRVALYVDDLAGWDEVAQVHPWGGHRFGTAGQVEASAAPGTLFIFQPESVFGRLVVAGDGSGAIPATVLPPLGGGSVLGWEVVGADAWLTVPEAFGARYLGSWLRLQDGAGGDLGSYEVVELDASGRARLEGAGSVAGATGYVGEYRFDEIGVSGGATLSAVEVLDAGAIEGQVGLPAAVTGSSLTIRSGSRVWAAQGGAVSFSLSGSLVIEAGAVLDVSGWGFEGGNNLHEPGLAPTGLTASGRDEGGSHGGEGGGGYYSSTKDPGEVFDSVYLPSLGGGGGGRESTSSWGGSGGGVVQIDAPTVVIEGEIRARGQAPPGSYAGAGAGGSIVVHAATLSGAGVLDASGGDYVRTGGAWGPPGGGGRVALYVDDLSGWDEESQVRVWGGDRVGTTGLIEATAAPGTLFSHDVASTHGRLRVAGDGTSPVPATHLPGLGSGVVMGWEVAGSDAWLTASSAFRARHLGAWLRLQDDAGGDQGLFEVTEMDGLGRVRLAGAAGVVGAATYTGEYRFDAVLLVGGAALTASDFVDAGAIELDGEVGLPDELSGTSLTVRSGSTVRPTNGGFHLSISGPVVVEAGALLEATGEGFEGGTNLHEAGLAPGGLAGSGRDEGGSHGGEGGGGYYSSTKDPGEVYDSVYFPALGGGGGGRESTSSWGGSGGGVVVLEAGSVLLEGEIRARGQNPLGSYAGAGAGGTIVLAAGSLTGGGIIDASGGDYVRTGGAWGPPGGGGRVALYVDDLSGWNEATQVLVDSGRRYSTSGGIEQNAAPGTVFSRNVGAVYGDLLVDQEGASALAVVTTTLPTPGTGVVGVVEADSADPADLWVEPQDAAALFDLGVTGMWLRVNGTADYRVLDQTADRRRVLLEGAAGLVAVGDGYAGVYKFDTVTVRGGAVLEFLDTAEVTTFDVDADSQVITPQ